MISPLMPCSLFLPIFFLTTAASADSIVISNTGGCSINIGILRGQLPTEFECTNTSQSTLDAIQRDITELSWNEHDFYYFNVFLPNTWRSSETEPEQFVAWPRQGTSHSELSMELFIERFGIAYWRASHYGWDHISLGQRLIPNNPHYLELNDTEYRNIARAHLYFLNLEVARLDDYEGDNVYPPIDPDSVLTYLSDSSELLTLPSYPYCEGGELVPNSGRALFTSSSGDGGEVTLSLHILPEVYFPQFFGYGDFQNEDVDESIRGPLLERNPFKALEFTDPSGRNGIMSVHCRGIEQTPGDIYSICRSILSQVEINNLGQFSC